MTVTAPRWIEDKVWYAAEASLKLNIVLPEPPLRCDCERVPRAWFGTLLYFTAQIASHIKR